MSYFDRGYYSPGIACPAGYVKACATTSGVKDSGDWRPKFPHEADEFAAGCRPRCEDMAAACSNDVASTYAAASYWFGSSQTVTITLPTSLRTTTVTEHVVLAPMVQLRWKATNTRPDALGSSSPPTPTEGSSASPSASAATDAPSPSGRLSTGAKAGVGAGVGVGGLLLLARWLACVAQYELEWVAKVRTYT